MPPKVSLGFACVSHRNRLWVLFPEWIPRVINEDLQRRFEFPGDWTCRHLNDPNHPKSFKLLLHALPFKVWDTSSTRIWSCIWRLLSCTWIHHMDTWLIQRRDWGSINFELRSNMSLSPFWHESDLTARALSLRFWAHFSKPWKGLLD
jgi:hypothetical protein